MLLQPKRTWVVEAQYGQAAPPATDGKGSFVDIDAVLAMLARHRMLILLSIPLMVALAVLYTATTKPLYTATNALYMTCGTPGCSMAISRASRRPNWAWIRPTSTARCRSSSPKTSPSG